MGVTARLAEEQPGGDFAPAGASARTEDAAVQVARLRQRFPLMHAAAHNTFNV
jgi:hypothetical protein